MPVVELVASKGRGLRELIDAAVGLVGAPGDVPSPTGRSIRAKHRPVLREIEALLAGRAPAGYPPDWVALKLLEGDADVAAAGAESGRPRPGSPSTRVLAEHDDAYLDIAGGRYDWMARMVRAAVVRAARAGSPASPTASTGWPRTRSGGCWCSSPRWARCSGVTYAVAGPGGQARSAGSSPGTSPTWLRELLGWAPAWLSGLLVDGVVAGAGTVLSFVPILVIFFAALGLLEDVGYMARTAYVMDRYMHWMGLHGKSCMPLLLGFGCNVPAILGTRIIEERKARLLTMMLTPFVPCTGRLAVLAFLAPAFFGGDGRLGAGGAGGGQPGAAGARGRGGEQGGRSRGSGAPSSWRCPSTTCPTPAPSASTCGATPWPSSRRRAR